MSKKVWTQAKKDRVQAGIGYWLAALGITPFNITYQFEEREAQDEPNTLMEIRCNYPYRNASLTCFRPAAELSDRRNNQCCAHEVMHIVLDPLCKVRLLDENTWNNRVEEIVEQVSMSVDEMATKLGKAEDEILSCKMKRNGKSASHKR